MIILFYYYKTEKFVLFNEQSHQQVMVLIVFNYSNLTPTLLLQIYSKYDSIAKSFKVFFLCEY